MGQYPANPRLYLSCGAPWHVSGRGVAEARRFSAFLRVYQRLIMLGMSDIAVAVYGMMILRLNPAMLHGRVMGLLRVQSAEVSKKACF